MKTSKHLAIMTADLGYGDAGKGSIVDFLARETGAHTVIRYNGGAQAAHNVITPDGRHHTFAQFGSGMFVPGVKTHLSRFMFLHPLAMLAEERHLQELGVRDAFDRTSMDREALVITPFQQAANRIKELARGDARHGSCGMGIGEAMSDWLTYGEEVLLAGDLADQAAVVRKLTWMRDAKIAQLEVVLANASSVAGLAEERKLLDDPAMIEITADLYAHFARRVRLVDREEAGKIFNRPGVTIFEGAQGVLLDEWWGFYPYNSWSTLTFKNAETLLREANFSGETQKLGLLRGYATRHGAGPFVTEDSSLTKAIPDFHNADNPWQRSFRVGHLDLVALRYALQVTGGVDGLVVTNLDRLQSIDPWQVCNAYQYNGPSVDLSPFFALKDSKVTSLLVPEDPTNLEKMAERTNLLMQMQPIYNRCERDIVGYLRILCDTLQTPVVITSAGPTAREKRWYTGEIGTLLGYAPQFPTVNIFGSMPAQNG